MHDIQSTEEMTGLFGVNQIKLCKPATFLYALLALLAIGLNRMLTGDFIPFFRIPTKQDAGVTLVATGLLMTVVWLLVKLDVPFMRRILQKMHPFAPMLIQLNQRDRIYISLLAGFTEELLFRGVLQPWWGIVAASLVFGILHAFTFGYFLLTTSIGFFMGWLLQYCGNLLVPITVHALYDIFALNLLAKVYRTQPTNLAPNNHETEL